MLPILADAFLRASLQRPLHERRWKAPKHWKEPEQKVAKPSDIESRKSNCCPS